MKRSPLVVALLLFMVHSFATAAEPLTETDREKLLAHLDITKNAFLSSVSGLTDAQWNYRAGEGRWTIAEVAEHIAAGEKMIREATLAALKTPASAELLANARQDEMIVSQIPNREKKFQAPEPLIPTNRFRSPAAAVEAFVSERTESMRLARNGGDLRAYAAKGPVGNLDAYGWLLFTSAHSERHTKQIEEVKASSGYPR